MLCKRIETYIYILDFVFSSGDNMVENLVVSEPFDTSDHNIITFDLIYKLETKDWKQEY